VKKKSYIPTYNPVTLLHDKVYQESLEIFSSE